MIERSGNSIGFYAFYTASKVGKTGLTVTIDVWERAKGGSTTEIVTAGNATEIGDGLYEYVLASGSVDATGEYLAVFKTADATVDQQHIPAVWAVNRGGVENLDGLISTRALDSTVAKDATVMKAASYTAPLDAAGTRTALGLATANLDTQLADLPTNAELTSALAAADDAVLAAIALLNNLSSAGAQAAAAAALTAYAAAKTSDLADLPTNAELIAALAAGVNLTHVAGVEVAGEGTEADPWGPAS